MVLHQFHTILRTRLIVEIPWSDPSISHSLLNDYAVSQTQDWTWADMHFRFRQLGDLVMTQESTLHQGEKSKIMEDKVRISNEFYTVSLKVIPNDVLSSSKFVFLHAITFCWYSRPTWTAEFIAVDVESTEWYIGNQVKYLIILRTTQLVKENRRLSQRTHNLWLADYGIPTGSFKLDFNCLLQFAATPWTVTHITLLQFSATPLRRFVFFPHLRHRYWVWVCLAAVSSNSLTLPSFAEFILVVAVLLSDECNTSITTSHKSRAGIRSIHKRASSDIFSDSVELWDTDVCFLHIQLMGTNVRLPMIHKIPPDVDFESSRSPATSESWNKPNRQCWAVFPTWQHCRWSFVCWM